MRCNPRIFELEFTNAGRQHNNFIETNHKHIMDHISKWGNANPSYGFIFGSAL